MENNNTLSKITRMASTGQLLFCLLWLGYSPKKYLPFEQYSSHFAWKFFDQGLVNDHFMPNNCLKIMQELSPGIKAMSVLNPDEFYKAMNVAGIGRYMTGEGEHAYRVVTPKGHVLYDPDTRLKGGHLKEARIFF